MHQPAVTGAMTLRRYRQDLAVSNFLFGLSPSLRSQVRGQILGGDNIPTLTAIFSRVMRVSTGTDVITAPPIEQSAMASGHGRGRGRDRERDFMGGRGSFGVDHGSSGAKLIVSDKGSRLCKHCGMTNHTSEKCWEKFYPLSGYNSLILILLSLVIVPMPLSLQRLILVHLYWSSITGGG